MTRSPLRFAALAVACVLMLHAATAAEEDGEPGTCNHESLLACYEQGRHCHFGSKHCECPSQLLACLADAQCPEHYESATETCGEMGCPDCGLEWFTPPVMDDEDAEDTIEEHLRHDLIWCSALAFETACGHQGEGHECDCPKRIVHCLSLQQWTHEELEKHFLLPLNEMCPRSVLVEGTDIPEEHHPVKLARYLEEHPHTAPMQGEGADLPVDPREPVDDPNDHHAGHHPEDPIHNIEVKVPPHLQEAAARAERALHAHGPGSEPPADQPKPQAHAPQQQEQQQEKGEGAAQEAGAEGEQEAGNAPAKGDPAVDDILYSSEPL